MNQLFVQSKHDPTNKVPLEHVEPEVSDKLDGTKQLSFQCLQIPETELAFDMLVNDNILLIDEIDHKAQRYIIVEDEKRTENGVSFRNVVADHMYIVRLTYNQVDEEINGEIDIDTALKHALKGSGLSFTVMPDAKGLKAKLEGFGKKKSLELMNDLISAFVVELDVNNDHIYVYKEIKKRINYKLDTRANMNTISVKSSLSESYTRIKGYGKVKEEKDTASEETKSYDSKSAKWKTNSDLNAMYAEDVGQTFSFTFKGTGFSVKLIKEKLGGKITFNIDKKTNKTFSTYKDTGKESHVVETVDVIRGLEDKEHTVVATFKGKDSKNPNTKKMKTGFRVSVPNGNFIGLYRNFKNDEKYMFPPVTYIHPDEKLFLVDGRPRVAETVYEDSISKKEDMEKLLKEKVDPYPKLTIELDFEKVYDPKLEAIEDNICKGAIVPVIADTAYGILFEGEVRVQEIKYNPLNLDMKPSVTLTNYRKDIIDYQLEKDVEMKRQRNLIKKEIAEMLDAQRSIASSTQNQLNNINTKVSQDLSLSYSSVTKTWSIDDSSVDGAEIDEIGNTIDIDVGIDIKPKSPRAGVDFDLSLKGITAGVTVDTTNPSGMIIMLAKDGQRISPTAADIPNGAQINISFYLDS
ncbi:phage tail protein [Bacillus safensis]|uniref:phage tail protein n=1 Tax=Bacillus safensis TaxID=561879 RepID=UPI0020C987B7|nr:phage tail protein [Bacillus safensis]MCP8952579.1 phage tail protein [Bacillus safensis]